VSTRTSAKAAWKRPPSLVERERIFRRALVAGVAVTLVAVVGLVGYGWLESAVLAPRRPAATVEGETIAVGDLRGRFRLHRLDLLNQYASTSQLMSFVGSDPELTEYFQTQLDALERQLADTAGGSARALEEMIGDVLVERELAERGVAVTEAMIDREIEAVLGFTSEPTAEPAGTAVPSATAMPASPTPEASATPGASPTPVPTPTVYTRDLFEANLRERLENLRGYGISEADYRRRVRGEIARNTLRDLLAADVERSAEMVWARHILVADQAAAEDVLRRLEAGQDWEALAAEVSQDTSNNDQGGDLGWFTRGTMVTEFEEAAFAAVVGEIVGPVSTSFGFHILQVVGHEVRPLDDAQFDRAVEAAFAEWLTRRRSEAEVAVTSGWLDIVTGGSLP
jgi:parvulin-like peptidyl-prolyl isomerase